MNFKLFEIARAKSVKEGDEEYDDIKWALIDFMDQGLELNIRNYENPEDSIEMTIALSGLVKTDWSDKKAYHKTPHVGTVSIRGNFDESSIGLREIRVNGKIKSENGKDADILLSDLEKSWIESLDSGCHMIIDQLGYESGTFSITQCEDGSDEDNMNIVRVAIHIYLHSNQKNVL